MLNQQLFQLQSHIQDNYTKETEYQEPLEMKDSMLIQLLFQLQSHIQDNFTKEMVQKELLETQD